MLFFGSSLLFFLFGMEVKVFSLKKIRCRYLRGRGGFLNNRTMDNLFLNRMITPVEDAAGGEADKTRDKRS
jgi:hypothetical protein